jgi:NAD(P) transhydrogenase subunit alpha
MIIGVPKESFAGERRVALDPQATAQLVKAGFEVLVEPGAGQAAGASDQAYRDKGAGIAEDRNDLFAKATLIVQVRAAGADPEGAADVTPRLTTHHAVIASCDPLGEPQALKPYAESGARLFSLELVPRITRAQSMDALSSMANIAGYKAVLMAASTIPRMFPMMMTAAGTIAPARFFVIGAGVAGLQAIATAKRLGGDRLRLRRPPGGQGAGRELGGQVRRDGASTPVPPRTRADMPKSNRRGLLSASSGRLMARVVAENDAVVTTAAIPGKKSPVLITG